MPGLTTYVMLLFGVSIAMYCIGYQPLIVHLMQCPGTDVCAPEAGMGQSVFNSLVSFITNPAFIGITAIALFVPFLIGGSFGLMYIIPLIMVFALTNFLLLPMDFLLSYSMPLIIKIIIMGFLELLQIMAVISFVRGGD